MNRIKRIVSLLLVSALLVFCIPVYSSAASALDGKKIIAFGDSLTQGTVWWNNQGLDTYPDILQDTFSGAEIINAGVRGDSTYNAYLRFENDVLSKAPDIAIICFGMNDQAWEVQYNRPIQTLDRYRVQLVHFIRELQTIGTDVILVTPNPVYEEAYKPTEYNNYEYGLMDEYCNEMREIALEYSCGLVDINYEITKRGVSTYVSTDGIHQTVEGHKLYADCIANYLRAVYDGVNTASVTVNYKNENGNLIGSQDYIGASGANIILSTPSHLGCNSKSDDIAVSLTDGASYEMIFENEIILSRGAKYTTTAPNRGSGNAHNDDGLRLVDGIKGGTDPGTSFYSGWNKTESGVLEITIDLGSAKDSNVYRLYAAGGFWGISVPAKMSVAVSDDAINFSEELAVCTKAEKLHDGKVIDGSQSVMYTFTAISDTVNTARYIRFTVTPSGGNSFIWVDEAEVLRNPAEDKPVVPEPEYTLGDVNDDGAINQYDYLLVKRHYFGTRYLTDNEMLPADVNSDGAVNQYDYILIKRHYFGTYTIG